MERSAGELDELEDFAAAPPMRRIVSTGRRHCEGVSLAGINRDAGDIEGLRENQRHDFDSDLSATWR